MEKINSAVTSHSRLLEENTVSMGTGYQHTSMISHRGKVIAFGLNDDNQVVYNVLNLSSAAGSSEKKKAKNDSKNWANVPKLLAFPKEISELGYAAFGHTNLKQVNGDNEAIEAGDEDDLDVFHSSTAKLTANKPFLALSDERYVYLFRQSTTDEKLLAKDSSPKIDDKGKKVFKANHEPEMTDSTPLVNNGAVLMDRFVLSGSTLKLCRELRYQRSREKTNPYSAKDTLSGQDLDGKPFYEPTRQLPFISGLPSEGCGFTVTLLPDGLEEGGGKRWQIFYVNKAYRLCSINIKYDVEAVFDFRDQSSAIEKFLTDKSLNTDIFHDIQEKLANGQDKQTIASGLIAEKSSLDATNQNYLEEVVAFCQNGLLIDQTHLRDHTGTTNADTVTGMSACMYYQKTSEDKEKKKQKACVMLALGVQMQSKHAIAIISYDLAKGGVITNINKDTVDLASINLRTTKDQAELKLKTLATEIETSKLRLSALLRARKEAFSDKKSALFATDFSKGCNVQEKMLDDLWNRHDTYYDDTPMRLADDIKQCGKTIKQYQAALHGIDVVSKIQHTTDFSKPIRVAEVACSYAFGATAMFDGNKHLLPFLTDSGWFLRDMLHRQAMSHLKITHDDSDTLKALIDAEGFMQDKLHEISDEWVKLSDLQQQWLKANQAFHTELSASGLEVINGDASGMMVQGGILSMGDKDSKCPTLYDDPLGLVNLYFVQDTDTPAVLYFDPSVEKINKASIEKQKAIEFKPNTDLNFKVDVELTPDVGDHTVSLKLIDSDSDREFESWQYLPKRTDSISNILNGDDEVKFGSLYKPYVAGESFLVVKAKYTSEVLSLSNDLVTTIPNEGLEQDLPPYLVKNPILSVGEHRFGLKVDGKITISKGSHTTEELDALSKQICDIFEETVEQDAPIDKVKLSVEEVDAIRLRIQENNAEWCTIIFPVETSSMRSGSISADCEVSSSYNYKGNFTFSLDPITHGLEKDFSGERSFLFQTKDLGGGIVEFERFTYENKTYLGKWHPTQAGMCLEFQHAASESATSQPGYMHNADPAKLKRCMPTNQGLSMEAWVRPTHAGKYEHNLERPIVYFNNGKAQQHYALSLQKDAEKGLKCVASVDGMKLASEDTIPFDEWHHLAFVYRRYWSVALTQQPILCGKDVSLDFEDEYSIEVFVRPQDANQGGVLLSKGNEYQLSLSGGTVSWEISGVDMLSGNGFKVGNELTKITISRMRHKPSEDKMKLLNTDEVNADQGKKKWYKKQGTEKIDADKMLTKMETEQNSLLGKLKQSSNDNDEYKAKSHQVKDDKYFYTLAVRSGNKSRAWTTPTALSSDVVEAPDELQLGSTLFTGTFLSVRLWNRILNDDEVKEYRISEDQSSLVSWWAFAVRHGRPKAEADSPR